jgi:hypothetical protein
MILVISHNGERDGVGNGERDGVGNGERDGVDTVPYKSLVSTFVRSVKTTTTKEIGFSLWQRSFHDHIIRDEADYSRIAEYIEQNPAKWEEDCFYGV